jgi:hypothetical protein
MSSQKQKLIEKWPLDPKEQEQLRILYLKEQVPTSEIAKRMNRKYTHVRNFIKFEKLHDQRTKKQAVDAAEERAKSAKKSESKNGKQSPKKN